MSIVNQFTQSDELIDESDKAEARSEKENDIKKKKRKSLLYADDE